MATDEQKGEIVRLWSVGHSAGVIGNTLGVTRNTVMGYVSRMDLPNPAGKLRNKGRPTDYDRKQGIITASSPALTLPSPQSQSDAAQYVPRGKAPELSKKELRSQLTSIVLHTATLPAQAYEIIESEPINSNPCSPLEPLLPSNQEELQRLPESQS